MLLQPGKTCWRTERAGRVALLVENAAYFRALLPALKKARKSITILGWQFDPRTRLDPYDSSPMGEIGFMLRKMARENPDLDIRLLIWRSPLPIAFSQGFFPQRAQAWFQKNVVNFRLDRARPIGGCHHQKVVIIDDAVAFCGGGDISVDRFDTHEHLDDDPRRCMPNGALAPPRHEVMMMVDGAAARALGDLARERWAEAVGERCAPVDIPGHDPWPEDVPPDLRDVEVGVARTEPAWRGAPGIRENEALHLHAIAQARKLIYLENQYVTSPLIVAALAARLEEPDGPEVVIVSTGQSPSYFDKATMDGARSAVLARLESADVHNRCSAWTPWTRRGRPIIVHSKVTMIDDRFLRVGSTNLNNRSCGFDTECDIALEIEDETGPQADFIRGFRARLLSHFLGIEQHLFEAAYAVTGTLGATIDGLNTGRLGKLGETPPSGLQKWIADYQMGDPASPADAWRPWRRGRLGRILKETVARAHADEASGTD
ncbi:MAG TPA: phospholipase D-like domain-containing protein [Caulobacteraceae bacterium]|nr:phospholipase D-like domain-containing protein [Caulobacteraceae bacterium]